MRSGFLVAIPLLSLFWGCSSREGVTRVRVNLTQTPTTIESSDYFDRIELIPLESKAGAFLGQSSTVTMQSFEGKYYFLNKEDHLIQVFDQVGHHVETINKYGRGPGEYLLEQRILINRTQRSIDVLTQQGRIYVYSLDDPGHPLIRVVDVFDKVVSASSFIVLPSGYEYVLFCPFSKYALYLVDARTSEVRPWPYQIPGEIARSPYWNSAPFYYMNGILYYVEGHTGTIYSLDLEHLLMTERLKWDFGRYSFSRKKLLQDVDSMDRILAMDELSSEMASPFNPISENDQFIFCRFYFQQDWNYLIYDKRQERAIFVRDTHSGVPLYVGEIKEEWAYYVLDPPHLQTYVDTTLLDSQNKKILRKIQNEDNNVIVKTHLKKRPE